MKAWAVALLLTLASIGGGVLSRGAAVPDPAQADVLAWFAARGVVETGPSAPIGGAEGHRLHLLGTGGCRIGIVPLDSPEEVLPILRRHVQPAVWAGARHWLGDVRPGVPDATTLHLRRLWLRLRSGAAPRPALVLAEPGCEILADRRETRRS